MRDVHRLLPVLLLAACSFPSDPPAQPACETDRVQDASRTEWAALQRAQADTLEQARRRGTAAYEAAAARAAARLHSYRAEHTRRMAAAARVDSVFACPRSAG
ncbi:hypothetical protein [Longimicrobium sp.]|uniref:hypothetical protein n=1 Tax=Longimicrobium sp. TaxID=2029185 RepID=UPI002E32C896|nr:hypothetical protein [Longimicrobium sp.]HEX6037932.1 hypothetical protein [Longimicrobium sp.]